MRILQHFLVFVAAWGLLVPLAALRVPPPWGSALAVVVAGWLVWGYLLRPGEEGRSGRERLLRMNALEGEALRWTLLAVPAFLLLTWSMGDVYVRLVPVPEAARNPFGAELDTTLGRASIAVLAIGLAPFIEEFFFRGLIQSQLEERLGGARGVAAAAALFALAHFLPWVFPIHFFLGACMGFVVYATRSIWAAVILHATNNVVAMAATLARGTRFAPAPDPTPTLWEAGATLEWWGSLAALAAAGALAAWTARRLWRAGAAARLRVGRETP